MSPAGRPSPFPPEEPTSARPPKNPGPTPVARAVTFALPALTVVLAVLVFLGPGALRPAIGARVHGAPAEGAPTASLRVEVVTSRYGQIERAGARDLVVEGAAPGQALGPWRGTTDPDGVAEVSLPAGAPLRGPMAIRVDTAGDRPKLLAFGEIPLGPPPPAIVRPALVAGTVHGDLDLRVSVVRGILAAPFSEGARIQVSPPGRTELELSGAGLRLTPDKLTTDDRGEATLQVEALAHEVELTVEARAGNQRARWEGKLPVVPGAMWVSYLPGGVNILTVRSPAPRERAYVSLWTDHGRVSGAIVPLARDPEGFHTGTFAYDWPDPHTGVFYATVAGDPLELGAGTVAWPLYPPEGSVTSKPIGLLLDGLPAALAREEQRATTARRAGLVLLVAAALAEAVLLVLLSRASQRRLEAHLVAASDALSDADRARVLAAARERPALRVLLGVALIGLGFAMVAALSTFR